MYDLLYAPFVGQRVRLRNGTIGDYQGAGMLQVRRQDRSTLTPVTFNTPGLWEPEGLPARAVGEQFASPNTPRYIREWFQEAYLLFSGNFAGSEEERYAFAVRVCQVLTFTANGLGLPRHAPHGMPVALFGVSRGVALVQDDMSDSVLLSNDLIVPRDDLAMIP